MIVVEVVFLLLFWSWVATAAVFLRNTILPRNVFVQTLHTQLPLETVQFEATDGMPLEGWRIETDPIAPWVILCHGVGSNRLDLLDIAQGLHRSGLNVFLFDFRGHGGSGGRATSFGWQEQRDLEGALAYLGQQPEISAAPYGVYGISMGGAVAIMVAATDERIGAVAADSPYTGLEETLGRHLRLMFPMLPRIPFLWYVLTTYRIRFGIWPRQISPETAVHRLGQRSLLIIHGAEDDRIPPAGVRRMFANAGKTKELWMVDGAGHLESFSRFPGAYLSRVGDFFVQSLQGTP